MGFAVPGRPPQLLDSQTPTMTTMPTMPTFKPITVQSHTTSTLSNQEYDATDRHVQETAVHVSVPQSHTPVAVKDNPQMVNYQECGALDCPVQETV